ncbi:LLM class flavin-dependent oxidoreductase [Planotetraspora kaengkrachanensis]|uniref:N5,N10-methylene tetrahydromethanopterin reductase n=1 Tax=Planotetraspora kaengkrachanensis TaxID=575193 RepID=A0A8J3PQS6_9ACTN|nr:LLM class flavin-dependent oxidoreductase [Planotetraspora kaengkrachanensis]GIG77719.1 N5,N10-methylene tetrahydromethanopterin reductase [Planotetraspora kaengkrachanensis]
MTDLERRIIHFNLFEMNCVGHIQHGLWTHPENNRHRYTDIDYWTDLATLLERGLFDAVFLADVVGLYDRYRGGPETAVREAVQVPANDPLLVVPAMAAVTRHLGFAVTFSTTYEPPFAHARRMSTLDHLTKGRVAWNVVTSYLRSAARNFGLDDEIEHDLRYEIAEEYLEVLYKLWEGSWEDGAVIRDVEARVYADPAKVHAIDHVGKHFRVAGPHLSEPSPQRTPVLYQAGNSERGRDFAARHAEAVFTGAPSLEALREEIADLKRRAAAFGRDPDHVKVFPGASVIVAPTQAEADAKVADLQRHISPEGFLAQRGSGIDLAAYDPDEAIDDIVARGGDFTERAIRPLVGRGLTVRDVLASVGRVGQGGPLFVAGTPERVADEIERWADETGAAGFNLMQYLSPGTAEDFIELVVPELQRRGRYRTSYDDSTLRERLLGRGVHRLPDTHPGAAFRRGPKAHESD